MKTLENFTENDYEILGKEIESLSKQKSDDELYVAISNGLQGLGYKVATKNDDSIVEQIFSIGEISVMKAFNHVSKTTTQERANLTLSGRGFWERFKEKLQKSICEDPKIMKLMSGEGSLKEYLMVGLPLVFAALGMGALNPVLLVIVAATFALILKVGWQAYCEV